MKRDVIHWNGCLLSHLAAQDFEDQHTPHLYDEAFCFVVQEALELVEHLVGPRLRLDLTDDELDHGLLLRSEVLNHFLLHLCFF